MKTTALEDKLTAFIRPAVESLGFELCGVKVTGGSGASGGCTVQVMAENPETGRLGIDDCTRINRSVSALMDVEDPIEGNYMLEISSPGIDRLLFREADYERYAGFDAKVELDSVNEDGQRRFRGVIKGMQDFEGRAMIILEDGPETYRLPYEDVRKAKLVLTDELIKATSEKTDNNDMKGKE
jgi:ribosome maturation factor RimP